MASADRITMLPAKISELADNKVNFISFTPATSFDLRSSQGVARERRLLYWMMQSIHPLKGSGPKNLFQGWVERADRWRKSLKRFREENTISPEILASFKCALEIGPSSTPHSTARSKSGNVNGCTMTVLFRNWSGVFSLNGCGGGCQTESVCPSPGGEFAPCQDLGQ